MVSSLEVNFRGTSEPRSVPLWRLYDRRRPTTVCSLRQGPWRGGRLTFCLRRLQLSQAWAVRCRCSVRGGKD